MHTYLNYLLLAVHSHTTCEWYQQTIDLHNEQDVVSFNISKSEGMLLNQEMIFFMFNLFAVVVL